VVRVKVLSVDVPRHRISLTLRLDDEGPPPQAARQAQTPAGGRDRAQDRSSGNFGRTERGARPRPRPSNPEGALADALRQAGLAPKHPDTGSIG
jgi:uncharacterized protein